MTNFSIKLKFYIESSVHDTKMTIMTFFNIVISGRNYIFCDVFEVQKSGNCILNFGLKYRVFVNVIYECLPKIKFVYFPKYFNWRVTKTRLK